MADFVKFEIKCDKIAFHRSAYLPLDGSKGHIRKLEEDLSDAIRFYLLRIEGQDIKPEKDSKGESS